ncbi:thioredoxin family protein [Flavobacterium sp. SUN052]|uniref:thioredoxin family protein n=1 Tax=Flavobacterium sp. SUN052 TaxID=3002441 RepID=UPI00237D59D7|nr:thioredoxin family protein [Flavobacterium sp. SUN052]MEC4004630.1 thioredoxin family protein [Flavobacterium sp. SUN052]
MKKLFITLLLVVSGMTVQAQEGLTWHTNIDEAISVSKIENKPLFLFFTGSDWCGWCIRLQNEVFKTPEFIAWAKEKVVLVELDFPRKTPQTNELKMQNNQLQQFFQIAGYPSVKIVKAGDPVDGKASFGLLGSTGYVAGGPTVWIDGANKMIANFVPYTAEVQKAAKKAAKKKKSTKKKVITKKKS